MLEKDEEVARSQNDADEGMEYELDEHAEKL